MCPDINLNKAKELWIALFALTHAVERLGYANEVDTYRNQETQLGAWMTARKAIDNAMVEPNNYVLCPDCGATHHEDEAHTCVDPDDKGGE